MLLLLTSLLIYGFLLIIEPYEESKDLGWDKNALRNPYLAAEQFISNTGINVTSSNNFDKLKQLPPNGTVFISNAAEVLTKQRVNKLINWIKDGGHLIIAAPIHNKNRPDVLLSIFNVENNYVEKDEDENKTTLENKKLSEQLEAINERIKREKPAKSKEEDKPHIPKDEITNLSFTNLDTKLQIHFSPKSSLSHPQFYVKDGEKIEGYIPNYWASSEFGTHFMQFSVGDGLLSVLSDKTIWESSKIDSLDHAHLLWLLSGNNTEVVILYGAKMPSIFYFIWKYAFELVISFCVWLLAWIVFRGRRFEQIRTDKETARRSISEHIKASADYLWRNKKANSLLEPARADIIRRVQHLYPTFSGKNKNEQIKLICNHSNLSIEQVKLAINKQCNNDEDEFRNIIIYLQVIRNTL